MNKYGNKKTIVNGIVFDSKKESERYYELMLLPKMAKRLLNILQILCTSKMVK